MIPRKHPPVSEVSKLSDFDPVSFLFTHQADRPDLLTDVTVGQLSATQRMLLTTDGTVTTLLENLSLEPVYAEPCIATPLDGGDVAVWLQLGDEDSLRERRVFLVGQHSGRPYVMARSAIVEHRASSEFFAALARARSGLGEVLRQVGMETTRELLWYGQVKPECYPDWLMSTQPLLSRAYRIWHQQRPLLFIHETFLP